MERILDGFLSSPKETDKALSAKEAAKLLATSRQRRNSLESLDKGAIVNGVQDTDARPGYVGYTADSTFLAELREEGLTELETTRYMRKTYRIERNSENGLVGIELRGSGRYADGMVYAVGLEGGRSRQLFFKETLDSPGAA